jgi:hypothetical protein
MVASVENHGMSERLIIEHFAGIQSLAIELKRINILIGPQASGKSVCAKLSFYFKDMIREIACAIGQDEPWLGFTERMQGKFTDCFAAQAWQSDRSMIRYELGDHWIQVVAAPMQSVTVQFSAQYQAAFTTNEPIDPTRQQMFIPAGRSYFANFQSRIFHLLANGAAIDPFLLRFGEIYENARNRRRHPTRLGHPNPVLIQNLLAQILLGRYLYQGGKDYLENPDGRLIEVAAASSGQQEALPMLMILDDLLAQSDSLERATIYIEEPEAHLFPGTQRDIVNLIAAVFKRSPINLQFCITTHSPYILAAFNNLLQAGELHHQTMNAPDRAKLQAIVPDTLALSIQDFAVYALSSGTCNTLINEEFGLIDTNSIDDVSNDLSVEFGQLLDLAS